MVATLPSSPESQQADQSRIPTKILRVGIIGCGNIFQSHSQAYPDNPNAVVVGFYDRMRTRAEDWLSKMTEFMDLLKDAASEKVDPDDSLHLERCEIFEKEAHVYNRVEDLINAVDVVDICAPNYCHAPYTIWALKQGKSVMSEKPPARCSYETLQILNAIHSQKKAENDPNHKQGYYQINENFFWQNYVRELRKIIQSGILGEIRAINIKLGHGGPSWGWQNHFINPSLSGGGVLSDMGFHAIGIIYTIFGKDYVLKNVQSLMMQSGTQKERMMREKESPNDYYMHKFLVEDEAKIKIQLDPKPSESPSLISKSMVEASIETSWSKTYKELEILGSLGSCYLAKDELLRKIYTIELTDGTRTDHPIPPQARDSHQLEVLAFLQSIKTGNQRNIGPIVAHEMQTIVSAAYLSNLRAFEAGGNITPVKGLPVTPQDLDDFYSEMRNHGVPENIIVEEIVYRFMSPFTSTFYQ
ncbi:MAG: Gfo/Idh/MocA family protein [Promethearchaeota archaeon]